jgi:sulfur relay (sulfurtransferase) complex TusBCD TusD component (DsrE family)
MESLRNQESSMASYILIESRDPFECNDVGYFYGLAADLVEKGEQVTLFLVENGTLAARKDAKDNPLGKALERNVVVLADAFSVQERGIQAQERNPAIKLSSIDALVGLILAEEGTKVLWH